MPAFSVTPLTDVPPPQAADFPDFIQFQADGTDLGLADADTLNFSTGMTATRGTGENSNVVTVTATGAALQVQEDGVNLGAADVDTLNFSTGILATRGSDKTVTITVEAGSSASVLQLNSALDPPPGGIFVFDGALFSASWNPTVLIASANWEWVAATDVLHFITAGIYRLTITSFIDTGSTWPTGPTTFGSSADASTSLNSRYGAVGDSVSYSTWTDQHVITATAGMLSSIGLFATSAALTEQVNFANMTIVIERLGDAPA